MQVTSTIKIAGLCSPSLMPRSWHMQDVRKPYAVRDRNMRHGSEYDALPTLSHTEEETRDYKRRQLDVIDCGSPRPTCSRGSRIREVFLRMRQKAVFVDACESRNGRIDIVGVLCQHAFSHFR
jgi:hypothetical protein